MTYLGAILMAVAIAHAADSSWEGTTCALIFAFGLWCYHHGDD